MIVRRSPSPRPPSNWPAGVALALLATALIALVSPTALGSLPSRHAQAADTSSAASSATPTSATSVTTTSSVSAVTAPQSGGAGVTALSTDGAAVISGNRDTQSALVTSETDDGGDPWPAVVPAQVIAAASTMATAAATKPTRVTTSPGQSHHRDRAPPAAPLP